MNRRVTPIGSFNILKNSPILSAHNWCSAPMGLAKNLTDIPEFYTGRHSDWMCIVGDISVATTSGPTG